MRKISQKKDITIEQKYFDIKPVVSCTEDGLQSVFLMIYGPLVHSSCDTVFAVFQRLSLLRRSRSYTFKAILSFELYGAGTQQLVIVLAVSHSSFQLTIFFPISLRLNPSVKHAKGIAPFAIWNYFQHLPKRMMGKESSNGEPHPSNEFRWRIGSNSKIEPTRPSPFFVHLIHGLV